MNWDNSTVLKFLELYQMNPCIWDPQNESHKNRQRVNDAWNDIRENLGGSCTIKELKKKKESLMAAYRGYKTKIKKSERSGSGAANIYLPTWFAFAYMDSFLGSIYICNDSISSEENYQDIDEDMFNDNKPISELPTLCQKKTNKRQSHNPPEYNEAKNKMHQAIKILKGAHLQHNKAEDDECDLFGKLLAKKLRKLPEERRDFLINKISNFVYEESYSPLNS